MKPENSLSKRFGFWTGSTQLFKLIGAKFSPQPFSSEYPFDAATWYKWPTKTIDNWADETLIGTSIRDQTPVNFTAAD
jgi:hypothetical protein